MKRIVLVVLVMSGLLSVWFVDSALADIILTAKEANGYTVALKTTQNPNEYYLEYYLEYHNLFCIGSAASNHSVKFRCNNGTSMILMGRENGVDVIHSNNDVSFFKKGTFQYNVWRAITRRYSKLSDAELR